MIAYEDETDEEHRERFARETAEVDQPIEPAEVISPSPGDDQAAEEFPLESVITVNLCGLLLSLPGAIRARQTGHLWWRLDDDEKQLLGEASQPLAIFLVRKYLGESIGIFTATAIALTAVYAPRQIREMQEKDDPKKSKASASNPPPPNSPEASQPSSANVDVESPSNNDDWGVRFAES